MISLYDYQKTATDNILADWRDGYKRVLLMAATGTGKAQPLNAPILTPNGWGVMGDIHCGDYVVGSNGDPVRVVGVFPQGQKPVYRVTFSDSSTVDCCADHLWSVQTKSHKFRGTGATVKPLRDLMGDLRDGGGSNKWFIPVVEPVKFSKKTLPLDPYVLGVLIGDGYLRRERTMLSTPDQFILDKVADRLAGTGTFIKHLGRYDYNIGPGRHVGRTGGYVGNALRTLGLSGKRSPEKFIPRDYLFSDVHDRIDLLRGLMDTDGTLNGGSTGEYSTTSYRLALDVRDLVRSLGGITRIRERGSFFTYKGERRSGRHSYRIGVNLPFNPFSLPKKADGYNTHTKQGRTKAIADIAYVGEMPCQCISVDAPNGLYVTDGYTVTHNTVMFLETLNRLLLDPSFTRALIIAHTEELIFQPQERAMEMYPNVGLRMGTVMGASDAVQAQIIVGTVQTLSQNGRMQKILQHGPISHVIIDEAHHAIADTYRAVIGQLDDPYLLGCTATPKRTDKVGLGDIFQKVSYKITIQDAIRAGVLVPFVPFGFTLPVTVPDGWKAPEGEGESRKLGQLLSADNVMEIIHRKWLEFAGDRQTIIFTASVAQAHTLAGYFSEMGVPALAVDGTTKKEQRREILRAFKAKELQVLVNCQVLTEGFDAPETGCVVMAAPTGSDLVYVQRLGRGLRPHKPSGKKDCIVLDFAPSGARNLVFAGDVLEGVPKRAREQAERADKDGVMFMGGLTVDALGEVGFIDPLDVTAKVLDYLGGHSLAWSFDGKAATATVNETQALCILVPDRERMDKADEIRRRGGLNERSKRVLDWIASYRVYSVTKKMGNDKRVLGHTVNLETRTTSFDEAKSYCGARFESDGLGEKSKKWRRTPMSPAQAKLLENLGITEPDLTKGQAAQKITHAITLRQVMGVEEKTQKQL